MDTYPGEVKTLPQKNPYININSSFIRNSQKPEIPKYPIIGEWLKQTAKYTKQKSKGMTFDTRTWIDFKGIYAGGGQF